MVKKKRVKSRGTRIKSLNMTKTQIFSLFAIFIFLGLILSFTSFGNSGITGYSVSSYLTNVLSGGENLNETFLRWTVFIVLTFICFGVVSNFVESKFLRFIISLPIAFLSVALINKTEFLASVYSYGGFGLVVLIFGPIFGVFYFSAKYLEKTPKPRVSQVALILAVWSGILIIEAYNFVKILLIYAEEVTASDLFQSRGLANIATAISNGGGLFILSLSLATSIFPLIVIWKHNWFILRFGSIQKLLIRISEETQQEAQKAAENAKVDAYWKKYNKNPY